MAVTCEIQAGQTAVRGLSLGGVQTCFQIPQFDLLFDIGYCPRSFAGTSRLFITHGHADHAGGLINLLSLRLLLGLETPLEVFAPGYMVQGLKAAVKGYESFQRTPYSWNLNPIEVGSEIPINQRVTIRAFSSVHVVETIGYTAWERIPKLRSKYKDLPGREIARLKHAGEDLFKVVERPLLSFPGDTAITTLENNPHLFESRVLLLESTYIDDRKSAEMCTRHGHVHLDQVLERAARFKNEHLVLTHFSQSYRPSEVHQIIKERCADLFVPEIHPFAPKKGSWPG
jgi:ribonuclease Z